MIGLKHTIRLKGNTCLALSCWGALAVSSHALAEVQRVRIDANSQYLIAEFLSDNLVHFEASGVLPGPNVDSPIYTTPMVKRTDYNGPTEFEQVDGTHFLTRDLAIAVDANLCVTYRWRSSDQVFTKQCISGLKQAPKTIKIDKADTTHVYGLGEQFLQPGEANGQWIGKKRTPGDGFGNQMVGYNGGAVGNATFPVMYALGKGFQGYGLFFDHVYGSSWDFTGSPFAISTYGDQIRWYFFAAPDLPAMRRTYMDIVGHPVVPPRKAFGLWVSEYGFDNWDEIRDKLKTLRAKHFPIDGFVMDLQWFGGVIGNSEQSPMGKLTFDLTKFPNPDQTIKDFRDKDFIKFITIEESYISRGLPEHKLMGDRQGLAKDCEDCGPTFIEANPWWGKGGLIDWTNEASAAYWHDFKRQPLINKGIMGHWTDLGEPEMYNANAWYYGFPSLGKFRQGDVHNILNLKWAESIAKGYLRNNSQQRPLILSRSGTSGIQRYGTAMWSGDIGSNLTSLATHMNTQMHMSLSGIDYFGADIGGFHRSGLRGDLDEMYTQWFANGTMFDVPVRVHTENLCNCKETAPDRIGDTASNLDNLRLRYRLIPYLYSLAHKAYETGEAIFPPLVYQFQSDANVREMGHEKMLGNSLLVAIVAAHGETARDVYLPAGDWYQWDTGAKVTSKGEWINNQAEYRNSKFTLPKFAKAGAIFPMMFVDDGTLDSYGHRNDGDVRDELVFRAYRGDGTQSFTLVEDDGETIQYQSGALRKTILTQATYGTKTVLTINPAQGNYAKGSAQRSATVELVAGGAAPTQINVNGAIIPMGKASNVSPRKLRAASWSQAGTMISIQLPSHAITDAQVVEVKW